MKRETKKNKIRLDELLVEKKLVESRSQARAMILAGHILVDNQKTSKAGTLVSSESAIIIKEKQKFVGRGGLKLEKALDEFRVDVADSVCVDVGASTGGFTDCLLQRGAKKVYAIDVGYGQMHWKLQSDSRVVRMDRENFRNLDVTRITDPVDIVVMDVSFISAKILIPKIVEIFRQQSTIKPQTLVVLIKPQFEAGSGNVGKGGIVRDEAVRQRVVREVVDALEKNGFTEIKTCESPITGADGNREYLAFGRLD